MSAFGARRDKGAPIDLLPPEPGKRKREAARRPSPAIVDADFVVLPGGPAEMRRAARNDNQARAAGDHTAIALAAGRLVLAGFMASVRLIERGLQVLPAPSSSQAGFRRSRPFFLVVARKRG